MRLELRGKCSVVGVTNDLSACLGVPRHPRCVGQLFKVLVDLDSWPPWLIKRADDWLPASELPVRPADLDQILEPWFGGVEGPRYTPALTEPSGDRAAWARRHSTSGSRVDAHRWP